MAERSGTNPPGRFYSDLFLTMDRPTPFEAQRRAVRGCLTEMFGLDDFQLRAVARAVFYSDSVLVVQKTGNRKSVVPLAIW